MRLPRNQAADSNVLKSSPGKLYLHIANLMRRRVQSGEWAPGAQLPTLTDLAEQFGVANVTVRQAVAILESEGLVRRQQGRGTFVSDRIAARPTFSVGLDWPSLLRMVTKSTPKLITSLDAEKLPTVDPKDGKLAASYRYLKRVHSVNGVPCVVIDAYLDYRLYSKAPQEFENETIIPVIEAMPGMQMARCRQILTIGQADLQTATLLGIPVNSPMGDVRRIITDPDGVIIYLNDVAYRGDLVRFEIDLYPGREAVEDH